MAHEHRVYNTDEQFIIDVNARTITQQSGKNKLMQGDHNSERFEFSMDRYIDGHDMSLCDDVRVFYLNVSSTRDGQSNGPYIVKDLQIDPSDENKVVFSWLISRNATKYAGSLNFNIAFRCLSGPAVDYAWHTDIFKEIRVSSVVENNGTEHVEDHIDILEQWRLDVLAELNEGRVLSVNGLSPDESGNVNITIPDETVKRIESLDEENIVNLRDVESGSYVLHGYFRPHAGSDSTMIFQSGLVVSILKSTSASYVQVFYPYNNCVQYMKILDDSYEQNNVYLNDLAYKADVEELIGGVENGTY